MSNNFWIPENNHKSKVIKLQGGNNDLKLKAVSQTLCPATEDHVIRYRDLVSAVLDWQPTGEVTCFSCKKELKFQKVSMVRKCGHVYCKKCVLDICVKAKA